MTVTTLPAVEVELAQHANAALVFLHGLGADGHDFESVAPLFRLPTSVRLRCVFPHAPARPVTINGGAVMPAWFDVGMEDLRVGEASDMHGVERATLLLRAFVAREIERGIQSSRIVVGGFSQGGALAAYATPRYEKPLAGLVALSTFLVGGKTLDGEARAANKSLPAFVGHGTRDPLVPRSLGITMRDRLSKLGCDVEWHEYPMQHEVCLEEIEHLSAWLGRVLG